MLRAQLCGTNRYVALLAAHTGPLNSLCSNRSDGVVTDVWIAGTPAWRDSKATEHLGATHMGGALTVHTSA
jgi:hypothetical protein